MTINKRELLKIIERLSEEIELNFVEEISIEEDFFWDLKSSEAYNPLEEPNLMLGQIGDEWEALNRLLNNENASNSYDLKRLGVILQLLEFKIGADWILQSKFRNDFND